MADVNMPLRSALKDLTAKGHVLNSHADKLDERAVVEVLLDTFPTAHMDVCLTANQGQSAIDCDFYTAQGSGDSDDPRHYKIWMREVSLKDSRIECYRMGLDEVVWGDGNDPSNWKLREGMEARTMSDVIGWTSWILDDIPPYVPHLDPPPKHKMPNLQRLCWYHGPVPHIPFTKITLGKTIYEESPTTRWHIRFPRPYRVLEPGAYITLLDDPTGKRSGMMGMLPEAIASVVPQIEDEANEILRKYGKEPVTATHHGWGDPPLGSHTPVNDAVREGIYEVASKAQCTPDLILMHPKMLSAMMKEATPAFVRDFIPPNQLSFSGIKLESALLLNDGQIIFLKGRSEALHQITLLDYMPKNLG